MTLVRSRWLFVPLACLMWCVHAAAAAAAHKTAAPLSSVEQQQLRTMVEDIVSTPSIVRFRGGRLDNQSLLRFGLYRVALRRKELVKWQGPGFRVRVPAADVVLAARRCFGQKARLKSFDGWQYRNGYFYGESTPFENLGVVQIKRWQVRRTAPNNLVVRVVYHDLAFSAQSGRDVLAWARFTFRKSPRSKPNVYRVTSYWY